LTEQVNGLPASTGLRDADGYPATPPAPSHADPGPDYFREINSASTRDERHQIGERFGIRVVTGSADGPAGAQS